MTPLPGIDGSLLPGRFLQRLAAPAAVDRHERRWIERRRRQFGGWWAGVEARCGPATGLRAIFDLVAMPLAGLLGFRARGAVFGDGRARVTLTTPGGATVGLVVLPWAARPSRLWRDLAPPDSSPPWTLIVAPPFVSLVDTRAHAVRRHLDCQLPAVFDPRSFGALWTLCRAEAFEARARDGVDAMVAAAAVFQDGVRRDLQSGVATALAALEPVLHPAPRNREAGRLESLALVYRLLFLLFAESRGLAPARGVYADAYTLTALCRQAAEGPRGRVGLWDAMAAVTRLSRSGCETADLIVRPFNGALFARASVPSLETRDRGGRPGRLSHRHDAALADALLALATRRGAAGREAIAYADLGVEQLGAVYERVLDLDPTVPPPRRVMASAGRRRHSAIRKETGTFYTPQALAEFVVRRTLAPLVNGATADAILALRVVDPAMGSGAFLVAACRFLAQAYERALVDEGRCAVTDLDEAARAGIRRLIASRCLAGVDANPVAVQLARLSLWLVTLARDKPLSFFDHQLRVGDSLVGTSPDDLWRTGGRPAAGGGAPLLDAAGLDAAVRDAVRPLSDLRDRRDETIEDVRASERTWEALASARSPLAPWRRACDVWCARWFGVGDSPAPSAPELRALIDAALGRRAVLPAAWMSGWLRGAQAIAAERRFFHWPLEFADVFYDALGAPRARAGFDAVIGNPPWEMVRGDRADKTALVRFIRESGLYPSCGRGHLNLYQPFLERSLSIVRPGGRVGLVLPWGLASDEGSTALRRRMFERGRVDALVGFDNAAGLFPVHRGLRFLAVTASPGAPPRDVRARFGVRAAETIDTLPGLPGPEDDEALPVRLSMSTLAAVGGRALRVPDAREIGNLGWLERIARRFPALGSRAGWGASFGRELNATDDRDAFGAEGLPVIDGRHLSPFRVDVCASSRAMAPADAARRLPDRRFTRPRLAYRDVSGVANRYALIAAILPAGTVSTHTVFCLREPLPLEQQACLCGLFNSTIVNRIVRLLMGGHVTTALVADLPVPPWTGSSDEQRIADIAAALGATPAPAPDDARRLQAELDATSARLYEAS